ncbi:MAG: GDSL-like Lipase/Acylhydrolase [Marmoricola sp.]|nr:GDSL-like Lipase/Acylhydrolase [Marmoricola sp.]
MLAGDSITNASAGDYTWRYWLWRDLYDRGAKVDFVGSFKDTLDEVTFARGNKKYADCNFDQDHEARGGGRFYDSSKAKPSYNRPFTSSDPTYPNYPGYSSWIRGTVAKHKPAVLVAFVGTNDVALPTIKGTDAQIVARAISLLKTFIKQARLGNSGVDIVLTTAPNYTKGTTRFTKYNQALPGVVSSMSTKASRLVLAKMPSWANESHDGFHPNARGEVAIAAAINGALKKLVPSFPGRPTTLQKPKLGPRIAATLKAATAGSGKAKLTWVLPPGADRTIVYSRNVTGNGPWVSAADLVWTKTRNYRPNVGTATCDTPCTTFTVGGLSGGTKYAFRVRSAKGVAIATDIVSKTVELTATGSIGKVRSVSATAGSRSVSVKWPALGGAGTYDVRWRKAGSSSWSTASVSTPSRKVTGLAAGQKYGFQVRAKSSGLFPTTGAWSSEVSAVPKG